MANDRYKIYIVILLLVAAINVIIAEHQVEERNSDGVAEGRALFNPRVDYNEWLPVGRGDPLKNDPTYDYSPPVLDRVHYWGNSNKSKDKKEILLLGVTSKRSHKKEPKHNTIMRRNFFSNLPTRLMPPPMQTMPPTVKHPSTENYHGSYYRNHYSAPSQSWSHNSINYGDSIVDESINYQSVSRPHKNSIRNDYSHHHPSSSRKPWLHSLLEKEVTKPTPLYIMQPSRPVFESHPPPSFETISTVPPTTITTPVTFSNFVTTSEIPYFQPTITTTTSPPTTEPFISLFDQPQSLGPRPMYLIIEGHSKVKTYGQTDNSTVSEHPPKIVPIQADEESIIKHVVSEDDTGHAMEVMHLHRTPVPAPILSTEAPPSAMGDLLSLLDSSLGNFFLGEESSTKKSSNKGKTDKAKQKDITTKKPEQIQDKDNSDKNTKSEKSSSSEQPAKSPDNENSAKLERESRQIFDYDDLPEPSIREPEDTDFRITGVPKHAQGSIYYDTDIDYTSTEIV